MQRCGFPPSGQRSWAAGRSGRKTCARSNPLAGPETLRPRPRHHPHHHSASSPLPGSGKRPSQSARPSLPGNHRAGSGTGGDAHHGDVQEATEDPRSPARESPAAAAPTSTPAGTHVGPQEPGARAGRGGASASLLEIPRKLWPCLLRPRSIFKPWASVPSCPRARGAVAEGGRRGRVNLA